MKPAPFTYHAPSTVADALAVLAQVGDEGKVLAGGQSLVPLLNMRLAAPAHLVDVNRLAGALGGIQVSPDTVRVGALTRHVEVERHTAAYAAVPLLRQALEHVAHPVIRNRGTTVGSIVHADPAGEMTAVLALLGGSVEVARQGGTRTVPAHEFFLGPLESAVEPGELATAAVFPRPPARSGTAFVEVARRHGDYAVCGVAVLLTLDDEGRAASAHAAYISVGPTPVVLDLSDAVVGRAPGERAWQAAGETARTRVDPDPDIHATAEYRRHLAGALTARAFAEAHARARKGGEGR